MGEIRGTEDLASFNKNWAPYSGAPRVFPYQLAVTINSELERAMKYAVHLDSCMIFETLEHVEDYCTCGLVDLRRYVRKLASFRYDAEGNLLPKYAPIADGNPPLDE